MIDDKEKIRYDVEITITTPNLCAKVDPFALCTPTDCMSCKYSRVKITREDGVVMRNDTEECNSGYEQKYRGLIYEYRDNPIEVIEDIFGRKLNWHQKILINKRKFSFKERITN